MACAAHERSAACWGDGAFGSAARSALGSPIVANAGSRRRIHDGAENGSLHGLFAVHRTSAGLAGALSWLGGREDARTSVVRGGDGLLARCAAKPFELELTDAEGRPRWIIACSHLLGVLQTRLPHPFDLLFACCESLSPSCRTASFCTITDRGLHGLEKIGSLDRVRAIRGAAGRLNSSAAAHPGECQNGGKQDNQECARGGSRARVDLGTSIREHGSGLNLRHRFPIVFQVPASVRGRRTRCSSSSPVEAEASRRLSVWVYFDTSAAR